MDPYVSVCTLLIVLGQLILSLIFFGCFQLSRGLAWFRSSSQHPCSTLFIHLSVWVSTVVIIIVNCVWGGGGGRECSGYVSKRHGII